MLSFFVVLLSVISCFAQNSNAPGFPSFDPSTIQELTLDGPSITNTSPLEFNYYKIWIPNTVGSITFYLNTSNSAACKTRIEGIFEWSDSYKPNSYPGFYENDESMCWNLEEFSFTPQTGSRTLATNNPYSDIGMNPGTWIYYSVFVPLSYCSFTTRVKTNLICSNTTTPFANITNDQITCLNYTSVPASATNYSRNYTKGKIDLFKINLPTDTISVSATLKSTVGSWDLKFLSGSPDNLGNSLYSVSSSVSNGVTTYVLDQSLPEYGAGFFVISNPSNSGKYNITISYNVCPPTGAGYVNTTYQCKSPRSTISLPATIPATFTASNISNNSPPGGLYGAYFTLPVPAGTLGYLNLTCNSSTAGDNWVGISDGSFLVDCNGQAVSWFSCTSLYPDDPHYMVLQTQNLYPGGNWTFALCTNTVGTSMQLTIGGAPVPSPSVTPSASPSPSVTASVTPSISITPSPGLPSATPSPTPSTLPSLEPSASAIPSGIPSVAFSPSPSALPSSSGPVSSIVPSSSSSPGIDNVSESTTSSSFPLIVVMLLVGLVL